MGKNVFTKKKCNPEEKILKCQSIQQNLLQWWWGLYKASGICSKWGKKCWQSQKNYVNWVDKERFKGPKLADKLKRAEKEARPLDLAASQSLIF